MGLDTVEFVLWAEKKFGIDIPDEDVTHLYTVGEFCRYLAMALATRDGLTAPAHGAIYQTVVECLVREYRVPRDRISPDSRFVKDLGLE